MQARLPEEVLVVLGVLLSTATTQQLVVVWLYVSCSLETSRSSNLMGSVKLVSQVNGSMVVQLCMFVYVNDFCLWC